MCSGTLDATQKGLILHIHIDDYLADFQSVCKNLDQLEIGSVEPIIARVS